MEFAFDVAEPYPVFSVGDPRLPEDDLGAIRPGEAVRTAAGTPLPESVDAVPEQEETTVEDGHSRAASIRRGTYAYRRGSNVMAGERLFEKGERLSAKDAIPFRDLGRGPVSVYERVSTAILVTDGEIHRGNPPT